MAEVKNNVIVELYDLAITERKDDRFGRVVKQNSLNEDDLINIAVKRRTDLSPTSLKSTIELLKNIACEQIANGSSVAFGLGYFSVGVNGVFFGDNPTWNAGEHSLIVKVTPTAELRNEVRSATVNLRGDAPVGTAISKVIDVVSGETNTTLTPGGAVNIVGSKIKIAGDNEQVGISLINQANQEVTPIPSSSIAINEPSKITFVVPAALPAGDYVLRIVTQFSTSNMLLNEPRVYNFDNILAVG
jgi:hypothetical protein